MPVEMACPHCSQEFQVPDEYRGATWQCYVCEAIFPVPASDSPEDVAAALLLQPPEKTQPSETENKDKAGVVRGPASPQPPAEPVSVRFAPSAGIPSNS